MKSHIFLPNFCLHFTVEKGSSNNNKGGCRELEVLPVCHSKCKQSQQTFPPLSLKKVSVSKSTRKLKPGYFVFLQKCHNKNEVLSQVFEFEFRANKSGWAAACDRPDLRGVQRAKRKQKCKQLWSGWSERSNRSYARAGHERIRFAQGRLSQIDEKIING